MKKNDIIDGTTYLVTPNGTSKFGGRAVIKAIARLPVYRRASSAIYGASVLAVELCQDYKGSTYINQDAASSAYHGSADLKAGDRMIVRTADIVRPWTEGDDQAMAEEEHQANADAQLVDRARNWLGVTIDVKSDSVIIARSMFELHLDVLDDIAKRHPLVMDPRA